MIDYGIDKMRALIYERGKKSHEEAINTSIRPGI